MALFGCQPAAEIKPDPIAAIQGRWQSDDKDRSIWIEDHTIELLFRDEVLDVTDVEVVSSCSDPMPADVLGAFRYESDGNQYCFDVLSVAEDSFTVIYDRQGLEKTYRRLSR